MINLLPITEKQKILAEKNKKLTIILGIVVLVSLICFVLILLSIRFYILSDTDYQKSLLAQAKKENQTSKFNELNGTMQKYNGVLAQLSLFYKKELYINQALNMVSEISSPNDIYFTYFSISRGQDGGLQVGVAGVSGTRDDLLVFKKNLESVSEIKNPSFSPESWISPKNAKFSLTFEIDQNEK